MSKVKIEGNASGTGTLTISAPNTNTDRSLTLPDGAGEILTDASTLSSSNLSGALPAIDGSSLTGISSGSSDIDAWQLTSSFTGDAVPISANLSRIASSYGFGGARQKGTGMSVSSGAFTFPATGYWLVTATIQCRSYGDPIEANNTVIKFTQDSSTWYAASTSGSITGNQRSGYNNEHGHSAQAILYIDDTSTDKVRFERHTGSNSSIYTDEAVLTFTKIGEV